ncbi:carboxypeptidase regulatory-like domain-containing protein [Microbacterium fluvii]|uniref:alpha-amylase n=1 Tax=Microbacterium fluvii TaxID=415215 RepID=A0ABW2HA56_9MICO|nr:carboxypeptidase regulatory-like domain-containing protein [Microbacterium fluvii]MCU4671364.1 carboxypeptidase regulatory-like domain-containing protein [Microbacterium fluvii]
MTSVRRTLRTLVCGLVTASLVLFAAIAPAVADTAPAVSGHITHAGGAIAAGSKVTARTATDAAVVGTSTVATDGSFSFAVLDPGTYDLTFTSGNRWQSFDTATRTLEVGTEAQSVSWDVGYVTVSIVGRLTDSVTGKPIASTSINASGPDRSLQARTDADGEFRLDDLRDGGQYTLTTTTYSSPYVDITGTDAVAVRASRGETRSDLMLDPLATITTSITGAPAGARVSLEPVDGGYGNWAYVNDAGSVTSTRVWPGTYKLRMGATRSSVENWYPGVLDADAAETVTIGYGDDVRLSWTAPAPGRIVGTVRDATTGAPIPEVSISIDSAQITEYSVATDANGRYEFSGLTTDEYTLTTPEYTHQPTEQTVAVTLGEVTTRDFTLTKWARIVGTVTLPAGAKGSGSFTVYDRDLNAVWGGPFSSVNGSFRTDPLAPGEYLVKFSASGARTSWYGGAFTSAGATPVTVTDGVETRIAHEMPAKYSDPWSAIEGKVTGPRGEPVEGLTVAAYDADGEYIAEAFTDAYGDYSFLGRDLPTGDYRLRVQEMYSTSTRARYDAQWVGGTSLQTARVFTLAPSTTTTIDVRVTRTLPADRATIVGVVTRAGQPDRGAFVTAQTPDGVDVASTFAGLDGRFVIEGLPAGTYRLRIGDAQHWQTKALFSYAPLGTRDATAATLYTVSAGGAVDVTTKAGTVLGRDVSVVRGRVTSALTGEGVAGMVVSTRQGATFTTDDPNASTDEDGYYEIEVPSGGKVKLAVLPSTEYDTSTTASLSLPEGRVTVEDFTVAAMPYSSAPTLPKTARVGSSVTVSTGKWTAGTAFTYAWSRNGERISGATKSSYTPTAADRGKRLSVTVTGKKAGYATQSHTSASRVVAAGALTTKTPTILGTRKVGKKLTAAHGTWTSGTAFTYQWYANGTAIKGATRKSFTLTWRQGGDRISVKVTGKKSGYTTASQTSARTGRVAR